jgi:hypothetical protein
MTVELGSETLFKAALDIWMHQNKLMWDRLQTLSLIQIPLLGASFALATQIPSLAQFAQFAALTALGATFLLWHRTMADRHVRNRYQYILEEKNFIVGLEKDVTAPCWLRIITARSFLILVYGGVIAIDGIAWWVVRSH